MTHKEVLRLSADHNLIINLEEIAYLAKKSYATKKEANEAKRRIKALSDEIIIGVKDVEWKGVTG